MADTKPIPVINPDVDLGEYLAYLIGETGVLLPSMGGYKIKVFHTRMFPWDDVFKAVLFRGFKVQVTNHKADLFLDIQP